MILALDYDGTYTKDPAMWLSAIQVFRAAGHEVFCCTMRTPEEVLSMDPALRSLVMVVPTSREAKGPFVKALGIPVDIWIDDSPMLILQNSGDGQAPSNSSSKTPQSVATSLHSGAKTKARLVLPKPSQGDSDA